MIFEIANASLILDFKTIPFEHGSFETEETDR